VQLALSPRLRAVLQALLVTFLWSTSWVLIKIGLKDIPALTFVGLRYSLAFLCLLPFAARPANLAALRGLSRTQGKRLLALGLLLYAVTQGAQFLALSYLPTMTVSLLLSFTPVIVALVGIRLLAERPTALQWGGVGLYLGGALLYFYRLTSPGSQGRLLPSLRTGVEPTTILGLIVIVVGVLANASGSLLGRQINRQKDLPPLAVTTVSMGVGALVLLATGIPLQGLPRLSLANWAIIGWLALINTAFAFTLWNRTLRTLPAIESSIIENTMLIQIALLAWLFLDESLTGQEIAGLALAALGTLIVQLRRA
jgi:drug/metabolite transporter (DMT)-like permease